jgi:hypothetical protein
MRRLIFLLEEPSAEEMLKGILTGILPDDVYPDYKVFEGKQDLEKRLPIILRAWKTPDCSFIVIRDQDSGDCLVVKQRLSALCRKANRNDVPVLIRLACRELESFYLGDLIAVEKGIGINGIARLQKKKKYRDPDRLGNPSGELERLTAGCYTKVLGSRAIAPHLDLVRNRSHSFNVLVSGIRQFMETP